MQTHTEAYGITPFAGDFFSYVHKFSADAAHPEFFKYTKVYDFRDVLHCICFYASGEIDAYKSCRMTVIIRRKRNTSFCGGILYAEPMPFV